MRLKAFSKKQLALLTWWCDSNRLSQYDAVICDGAVRSGKTLCMSISFISWAFHSFHGQSFAICGKTITSLRRNVILPLINILQPLGFQCEEKVSKNYLTITYKGRSNRFYIFGGKDEGSASLIQGITLAGLLLDEVALMPRSFVEQALARCSVTGSKFWFNCNPEHPFHWFYKEWIQKAKQKRALYLHFVMEDNPSLSPEIRRRYRTLYTGTFYERFILGRWVAAQGLVYPMFSTEKHLCPSHPPPDCERFYVSVDYGTLNPTSMGLWGIQGDTAYRLSEFYYNGRERGISMTDEEYYTELEALCGDRVITAIIVDPSAASFIECIRRHGRYPVIKGENDVLGGIHRVGDALNGGEAPILPRLHRHPTGVRTLCLAGERKKRLSQKGKRPRDGRHPLFRKHGSFLWRGRFLRNQREEVMCERGLTWGIAVD